VHAQRVIKKQQRGVALKSMRLIERKGFSPNSAPGSEVRGEYSSSSLSKKPLPFQTAVE